MKIATLYPLLLLGALSVLTACDSDPPDASEDFEPVGFAEPVVDSEFRALSATEQYQVANKLLGSMYKGIPVEDFFELSGSLENPRVKAEHQNFIQNIRNALNKSLSNQEVAQIQEVINSDKYSFSSQTSSRPKEEPLALIYEYPLSRDSFVAWMAYVLTNTIMFSPAEEMESTDIFDVQNTYKRLVTGLQAGNTVQQIIRSHLPSLQRWRVARTPENAGIEGFELYLGLFETKNDSVKVGKACQDFYLTGEDQDYLLASTNNTNTTPQIILREDTNNDGIPDSGGYFITSCDDFYNVLSSHPLIIPRSCAVIANYLMAERSAQDKLSLCESIVSSGATTYSDIFKGILFSKEFLFETERPKNFEESFMNALSTLKWDPAGNSGDVDERIWRNMASDQFRQLYLGNKSWNTMTLKIGRSPEVPLDALSFANYHKAVREQLLINDSSFEGRNGVEGLFNAADGTLLPQIEDLSPDNFLHFLFLSALHRPANSTELSTLRDMINTNGHLQTVDGQQIVRSGRHDDISDIVFDYVSRLAEFYYFKRI